MKKNAMIFDHYEIKITYDSSDLSKKIKSDLFKKYFENINLTDQIKFTQNIIELFEFESKNSEE